MKYTSLTKIALLLFLVAFSTSSKALTKSKMIELKAEKDSIGFWIKSSKNKAYTSSQQKIFLLKAYKELKLRPEKKSKARNLSSIAYRFYELKDTLLFKNINRETLNLAYKIKDSFAIADAQWSYADYYLNGEIYNLAYKHFSIAYDHFNGIKKEYEAARMLYSMSFIKARYRDYTGSEILTFEAIKKFKTLKNYNFLYQSYNRLGLLQNDIKEYDKALFYHQKALEYLEKMKDKRNYQSGSLNNIGLTYLKKEQYRKAINYFNKSLLYNIDIGNHARIIDNRAYCKLMLDDTINVKKDLYQALKIRDSIHDKAGILSSKIRISEYYKYINDTIQAIKYAKEANILARKIKNGGDYLESLNQLAILDAKNAKQYLERYIQFNDSLIAVERKEQNKFTRIDFETDEYIEETKRLSEQKIWIISSGISIVLILSLLYFLRLQKNKTEKLLLETEQQKANEQVFLLTIQQQATLEEEKVKERNRISEELHDGVLSRLFGTRVGLGFIPVEENAESQQKHQSFLEELQEIEKEIREVSHKLNASFESSKINFTTIVGQLLKDKSKLGGFEYEMNNDTTIVWEDIDQITKINIYRILQEAIQNVIKHANAQHILIDFSIQDKNLLLSIKDDGHGFEKKKNKKGIGMKNISSRVHKLNGSIEIFSAANQGTNICIQIPFRA
ncbi:MAG: tetratricopeptide repeat protein [Flavobacteriaceae bacterium]